MATIGRIILELASVLITLGGLYDLLAPELPPNLATMCNSDPKALKLVRELLRALGGALIAIGLTVGTLTAGFGIPDRWALLIVLLLVLPAEGINAICMRRVGSPYWIPLGFALLALLGVVLAWPSNVFY